MWSIIFGRIAMWGNVIEHAKGYRAEFVRGRLLICRGAKARIAPGRVGKSQSKRDRQTDISCDSWRVDFQNDGC
jgi:hypothetical protein